MRNKVFISYRHVQPDEELANGIASFLQAKSYEVFIDKNILTGQDWIDEIDAQIRTSQYFVVLLSEQSIRSEMVRREVKTARNLKNQGRLRILPVRVAYTGELPYDLGAYLDSIQYAIWTEQTKLDSICENVLKGIQGPPADAASVTEDSVERLALLAQATSHKGAPLPSADPRLESGAVKLDSPFYVRRAADEIAEQLIIRDGVTVLVKGPRQVGKTSLLARAQAYAQQRGLRMFYIDFQLTDESRFESLNVLLRYLATRIAKELCTKVKPIDCWDDMLGATDSLTEYIEKALLDEASEPIVFAFDEVDNIFKRDFRNGFFAMVRAWHNRRAMRAGWNRLNLLIGHSTEPALFIDDLNQSPFNVGEVIRLGEFKTAEADRLNNLHGQPLSLPGELQDLMTLLGGQPYLTQQAFYWLRTTMRPWLELRRTAADDDGPFGDHLRRLLWDLRLAKKMGTAVKQVLRHGGCENESEFQRLRAAGLVSGESREAARIRCELYRQYFTKHL